MSSRNLLTETLEILKEIKKSPFEVVSVFTDEQIGSWYDFVHLANFEYDAGYGGAEVDESLVVVFSDGSWLEREEYDGSEWWDFKTTPIPEKESTHLTKLSFHNE